MTKAKRERAERERAERERVERERAERERAEQMQHNPNDKVTNEMWSPRYHLKRVARGAIRGLSMVPLPLLQSGVHSLVTWKMRPGEYVATFAMDGAPAARGGGRKKKKSRKHTTHQSWATYRSPKTQTRKKHNKSPTPVELIDFARDARPENNPPPSKPIKPGSRAAHTRDLAYAQTARDREECRQTDEINRDWQLTDARWLADLQRRQQRRRRKEEKQRDQMRKSKVKSAAHLATVRKTKSIKKSASGTKHRRHRHTHRRRHRKQRRRHKQRRRKRRRKPTPRAKHRHSHRRHK